MFGILAGCIINIALTPVLIFMFDMGIAGSSISTAISQCISLVILTIPFFGRNTVLRLGMKKVALSIKVYWDILMDGMPSLFRQGSASVAAVLLNLTTARHGDASVAAMSIVTKIFMVIFSILIGYGQGYQPVVGYNYGAKKKQRVKAAFWFTLKTGTVGMTFFGVLVWFLAPTLMRAFLSHDKNVLEIGTAALRMQCFATPFMALGVVSNMTLQAVGRNVSATILTAARQGIFFVPLILTLPRLYGLNGIEIAQPIADAATFLLCIPFLYAFFRKPKKLVVAKEPHVPEPKAGNIKNKKIR
jgi:Na+-driven multidrug efflux pump